MITLTRYRCPDALSNSPVSAEVAKSVPVLPRYRISLSLELSVPEPVAGRRLRTELLPWLVLDHIRIWVRPFGEMRLCRLRPDPSATKNDPLCSPTVSIKNLEMSGRASTYRTGLPSDLAAVAKSRHSA